MRILFELQIPDKGILKHYRFHDSPNPLENSLYFLQYPLSRFFPQDVHIPLDCNWPRFQGNQGGLYIGDLYAHILVSELPQSEIPLYQSKGQQWPEPCPNRRIKVTRRGRRMSGVVTSLDSSTICVSDDPNFRDSIQSCDHICETRSCVGVSGVELAVCNGENKIKKLKFWIF